MQAAMSSSTAKTSHHSLSSQYVQPQEPYQQQYQHHIPNQQQRTYQSHSRSHIHKEASKDMDDSDRIYHSAAQGMSKMAVDSKDEDHHTTATASTAAATQASYSLDDGSTVSESGTEIIMPPKGLQSSDSKDSHIITSHHRRESPYSAHSFKAGSHTFTVDTKYSLIRVIGSGAYGVVISAHDTSTNSKIAIKMVPRAFHDEVDAKRILREIKLLKHFDHENIVSIVDMMPPLARHPEDFNDVYIVAELMETDLHRIIYSKQSLSIDHVRYFLYQILRALKYIHSANVLHRDLKPQTFLSTQTVT